MNLGEILDRTFEIYRKRFLVFVGLAAMPAILMLGLRFADAMWWHLSKLARPSGQDEVFWWAVLIWIGFEHVRALVSIPIIPAMMISASEAAFGERVSILGSLRAVAKRIRSYFWIGVLQLLIERVIPEAVAAGLFLGGAYAGSAAGLFKKGSNLPYIVEVFTPLGIFIFLFLWLGACFSLAFPAVVFEDRLGFRAMRRSWKLSRNSRGRIAIVWLTIAAFAWVLIGGAQILFRWAMIAAYGLQHLGSGYLTGVYSLNAVVVATMNPLYVIAITLIYYDQRIRCEGYDIERMMEAAGLAEVGVTGGKVASIEAEPQETEV